MGKLIYGAFQCEAALESDGGGPGAQTWWEAPCVDTKNV